MRRDSRSGVVKAGSLASASTRSVSPGREGKVPNTTPNAMHKCLVKFGDIPPYMASNPFVCSGYRMNYTFWETFWSIFGWHNETLNIWTHLLGFFIFVYITHRGLTTWLADARLTEKVFFLVWGLAAQYQHAACTFFHWFGCSSAQLWKLGVRLDYMSISVLIVGSMYPIFHYLFIEYPFWQCVYLGIMTCFALGGIIFSWYPYFQTPHFQAFRSVLYVSMALTPFLALPHMVFFVDSVMDFMPIGYRLIMMGASYIFGAFIYSSKIPEKYYPGRFDTTFSSHVIWHMLTIIAALWHYSALYTFHEYTLVKHPDAMRL